MDLIFTGLVYVLILSCVVRHVVKTVAVISEYRSAAHQRKVEKYRH